MNPAAGAVRVAVVEDDRGLRESLRRGLTIEGFEVLGEPHINDEVDDDDDSDSEDDEDEDDEDGGNEVEGDEEDEDN